MLVTIRPLIALHRIVTMTCCGILLSAGAAQAQTIEWIDVPIDASTAVGANTIARQEDQITFDAIADRLYVRYSGNCRSQVLYRLLIGTLDEDNQPTAVSPYPNEEWFAANDYQTAILAVACEASS